MMFNQVAVISIKLSYLTGGDGFSIFNFVVQIFYWVFNLHVKIIILPMISMGTICDKNYLYSTYCTYLMKIPHVYCEWNESEMHFQSHTVFILVIKSCRIGNFVRQDLSFHFVISKPQVFKAEIRTFYHHTEYYFNCMICRWWTLCWIQLSSWREW